MPETEKKQDLSKKVMSQIEEGQVKMRPHSYFVVISIILVIGLIGAIILSVLFSNFSFLWLRAHSPFGYLWFGGPGFRPFLATFPWIPVFIAIVGLVVAVILLRHLDISYKRWFIALVIGLVTVVLLAGLALNLTGFNERNRQFEPVHSFYPRYFSGDEWVTGKITTVKNKELDIVTPEGKEIKVTWDASTLLPSGSNFSIGERIIAVGEWKNDTTFSATGISQGDANWLMMNHEMMPEGNPNAVPLRSN